MADVEEAADVRAVLVPGDQSTLVEGKSDDGLVIAGHAVPLLPWWKQRKAKVLISGFVIIIPIVLVVSSSSNETYAIPATINVSLRTNAPSQKVKGWRMLGYHFWGLTGIQLRSHICDHFLTSFI